MTWLFRLNEFSLRSISIQARSTALDLAAKIAKQNDGTVFILHIVPVDMDVSGMPQYVDLIKRQENIDCDKLTAIAKERLADVKYEILDEMGEPGDVISQVATRAARRLDRDGHARTARARAAGRGQHRRKSFAQCAVPGAGASATATEPRRFGFVRPARGRRRGSSYIKWTKKRKSTRCLLLISISRS